MSVCVCVCMCVCMRARVHAYVCTHVQRMQNVDGAISDGSTGGESIHGTGRPFNAQDRDGCMTHLSMLTHLKTSKFALHF